MVGRMPNLEAGTLWQSGDSLGEEVKSVYHELTFVGVLRVVSVADVKNIVLHILFDDKPRAAAEAQTLALSDGVEP